MQVDATFLVPETNVADDESDAVDAVYVIAASAIKENRKCERTKPVQPWISSRSTHGTYHEARAR